jgi:hypothetical protein
MDGRFVGRLFLAAAAALLLLFAASCTTASDGSRTGRRPILLAGAGDSETIAEPAIKDSQQSTRVAPPGRRLRRWNIRSREERPALDDGAGGVREADAPAAVGVCERQQRAQTNLVQLIPSIPGSDLSRDDGRCSRRHASINQAWSACMALPECAGVVRDNGIACGGGARLPFELRAGAPVPSRKTNAWVCPARLQAAAAAEAVARPPALGSPALREGFLFILHGGCARPDYSCTHVNELKEAVASLQVLPLGGRPIAVISDGGIPAAHLTKSLGVTYVSSLDHAVSSHANSVVSLPVVVSSLAAAISSRAGGAAAGSISGAAEELSALDDDLRVKKLRAYPASLFERTVFLDGDTLVRSPEALSLFSLLDAFDLAAAFECCRLRWSDPKTPYDRTGLMKGWEMQTGVMAYARRASEPARCHWANTPLSCAPSTLLLLARSIP